MPWQEKGDRFSKFQGTKLPRSDWTAAFPVQASKLSREKQCTFANNEAANLARVHWPRAEFAKRLWT